MVQSMTVEKIINDCISKIDENPFLYFSEQDIHAMLYCALSNEFDGLYEIGLKGKTKNGYPLAPFKTKLVHCEYGKGEIERLDIVVFSKEKVKNITTTWLAEYRPEGNGTYNYIAIDHAIEIKNSRSEIPSDWKKYVMDDLTKLKNAGDENTKRHFIYILRWPNAKDTTRKREADLIEDVRNMCTSLNILFYTNINNLMDIRV
jgi:hypothetical protein